MEIFYFEVQAIIEVSFSLADFLTKSFISKKFNFISNAVGKLLSAKTEKVTEFIFLSMIQDFSDKMEI